MDEQKDIFDKLMTLPFFRIFQPFYKKFKEQLLYLLFGALTMLVNLFVFWVCTKFLPPLYANIIAWIAGVVFAYVTNRKWVFASKNKAIWKEFLFFALGRLFTLVLEEVVLWVGISLLEVNTMVVKIVAQILVIVGNYVVSKWIVFRKKKK